MAYAMKKFLFQAISRAFTGWLSWYDEVKEQERLLRRGLMRMIKAKISAAYNTWSSWYIALTQERFALRRAMSKWAADGLLSAFTRWRSGRAAEKMELHARAAAFWLNGSLTRAWVTWRDGCAKARGIWAIIRRLESRHEAEKDELLEEIKRLRQLLSERTYAKPPKITFVDNEEDEAKLLKAAKMWANIKLAKAFNTLKWELEMARRNRSSALKIMTHWCNQALSRGWNSWRISYAAALAAKRSLGFWVNRAVAAAWNTWTSWVEDLQRQRASARNALLRWRHMQLHMGFNTWRSLLMDGIRRKNAMLRAVLRWGGSELFAAFGYWHETAEKIRVAELEFRAYLTKSYDPTSRSRSNSPVRGDAF